MAAWDDDLIFDRVEARGEADAVDGIDPTEAFYPDWRQDESVVAELRAELAHLNDLIDQVVEAA